MADKANDLLSKNIELTNQVIEANKKLQTQLEGNKKTWSELLDTQKKINESLKNASGVKEYNEAQKQLKQNIKLTSDAEKEQIKINSLAAREQEKLKREVLKTAKAEESASKQRKQALTEYQKLSKELTVNRNKAKDLAVQILQATNRFGKNSKQVKALKNEYNSLASSVLKTDASLKKIDSGLGQSQRFVGQYEKGLGNLKGGVKSLLGAFGVIGGLQLFTSTIKTAINLSKNYEKQNAVLASVLGKTTEETQKLQEESERLGGSTAFTSTEVVELQTELARLGKTEEEIIDSTEGIINATIALGSETGETAALVGSTLNSFKLNASESSRVADVLTLSTQKSALSFQKLNIALPKVSGAAAAANVPFEKMISQLAQVTDRGIEASTAGSSLRNIYVKLSESGLTYEQAILKINKSQDKLKTATQLFGREASVTALALADTTENADSLEEALNNAGGTAERVANQQLDTLDGKLKLLNSAWEGVLLSISSSEGAMGQFINTSVEGLTELLNLINRDEEKEALRLFSDDMAKESEDNLKRFAATYKKTIDDIKSKYTGAELEAAAITGGGRTGLFGIALPTGLSSQLSKDSEVLFEYADKLAIINKLLGTKDEVTKENIDSTEEQVEANEDLIKAQEELLKQAKELPGTTEQEITFRNDKIASINKEITRLKELRTLAKDTAGLQKMESKSIAQITIDNQKEIDTTLRDGLGNFKEIEELKTQIAKEEGQKRADVEKELLNQAYESFVSIANSRFDKQINALAAEEQAVEESFATQLASEELTEEQRSQLEAQRDAQTLALQKKQQDLEVKRFRFEQGVQVAEIAIDTARKVAQIQATQAVLSSNPATIGFAPLAAAQIPIVIGTGALAAASVLAQQPPQFDKGTDSAPYGGFIAGEKRTEIGELNGKTFLIDKPTYFGNDFAGMKITGGQETADIINSVGSQALLANAISQGGAIDTDAIINAIQSNRPVQNVHLNKYGFWETTNSVGRKRQRANKYTS